MKIEKLKKSEYGAAMRLAERSFYALDAKDYSDYGRRSFLAYASTLNFALRQVTRHVTFAAKEDGYLVGIIELRAGSHISMLFVEPSFVRRGVATDLMNCAVAHALRGNPSLKRLTVNSSPYAVPFYKKMGFEETAPLVDENGFVYIPMARELFEK